MVRYVLDNNVVEEAKERLRFIYDEFEHVLINISGGKDSTVLFHLAMEVAREKGRLPLKVLWIDQEVEWQATADMCERLLTHPDVEPWWFQMPISMTNNANSTLRFTECWNEADRDKWMREQHPLSIKENKYGTTRFNELFAAILKHHFPNERACHVAGIRAEESPLRLIGMTNAACYKHITWGKNYQDGLHYNFYPIYDWGFRDVWKYIHEQGLEYNPIYDEMYRLGVNVQDMRISSLHHEISIKGLLNVQEIEPETWERLTVRAYGVNTIKHLKENAFKCPDELPPMFESWEEYALFLMDRLVPDPEHRELIERQWNKYLPIYRGEKIRPRFIRAVIDTILSADWDLTKLNNFHGNPAARRYRIFVKKLYTPATRSDQQGFKWFTDEEVEQFRTELEEWKSSRQ